VEEADAANFKVGDAVTFINWGNMRVEEVKKDPNGGILSVTVDLDLDNKARLLPQFYILKLIHHQDYKKTLKVTWLANLIPTNNFVLKTVHYGHLISKAIIGKEEDWKQFVNRDSVVSTNN